MARIESYVCDRTGVQATSTGALEVGGDDEWTLPAGWAEITLRWTVPNTEGTDEVQAVLVQREAAFAEVKRQYADANDDEVRERVAALLPMPDVAPYALEERTLHYAPDAASDLLRRVFRIEGGAA